MALRVAAILKFNGEWRFTSPGPIASEVSNDFYNLIGKVVAQGNRQRLLEHFKSYFAGAAGMVSNWSSDEGWADTDIRRYMEQATENAPLFIEAFYGACVSLASDDIHTPDVAMINQILAKHDAGYKIEFPDLVALREQTSIAVEVPPPSLSDLAQVIIQQSLQQSHHPSRPATVVGKVQRCVTLSTAPAIATFSLHATISGTTTRWKGRGKIGGETP
jgi:hypothetical protein